MPHGVPAQQSYLFTDLRHILCSDLQWLGSDGQALPLYPQGPGTSVHASPAQMPRGIELFVERSSKTEPLPPAKRWRRRITYADGVYRAWSAHKPEGAVDDSNEFEICCEQSPDGFDWRTDRRCVVRLEGTGHAEGFCVFEDPVAPPAERFKAMICAKPPRAQWPALFDEYKKLHNHHRIWRLSEQFVFVAYGLISPDGLAWNVLSGTLGPGFHDTDTHIYYDEATKKYVMYTRLLFQQRRWVGRAESDDFRTWGPVQPMMAPPLDGPMTDDIYQNGFTFYPGERAYYLMFPMIYHRLNQRSSIHLYSSEDGIMFQKVPGGPVIEPGPPGSFDSEFQAVGRDLLPMGTDKLALPYLGTRFPHKYPRWPHVLEAPSYAYATWPRGRIGGVRAKAEGSFVTFPIEAMGRSLHVNARVALGGELRVGVVGQSGRSVHDCDPIIDDGLNLPIRWRGDDAVGVATHQPLTLEFKLRAADLFGFEWR